MKIKEQFVLQRIADEYIVVPIAEEADRLHGIIKLNEAGAFLWDKMSVNQCTKNELASFLVDRYGISADEASVDVSNFIEGLNKLECVNQ